MAENRHRRWWQRIFGQLALRFVPVRISPTRPGVTARLARTGYRFRHDRRGGTAVQMIVLLPVILGAFVVGAKLWETLLVRHSLHTGTYLATRYLSLYPPQGTNPDIDWQPIAQRFVLAELKNNPFVDKGQPLNSRVIVTVDLTDGGNQCTDKFRVTAEYRFLGPVGQRGRMGLPDQAWTTLTVVRHGEVICD